MLPGFEVRRVMDRFHWVLRGKAGAPIARSYKDYGTRLTAITASENVAATIHANLMERVKLLKEMKGIK